MLSQEISPNGTASVVAGDTLSFNCTGSNIVLLQLDRRGAPNELVTAVSITNGIAYTFGPVTLDLNGSSLRCDFTNGVFSEDVIPIVICEFINARLITYNWLFF